MWFLSGFTIPSFFLFISCFPIFINVYFIRWVNHENYHDLHIAFVKDKSKQMIEKNVESLSLCFITVLVPLFYNNYWAELRQNQHMTCTPSEDSDQLGHPPSLIRVFAVRSMGKLSTRGFFMRTAKTLIRLDGCPGWSESSLGAYVILLILWCCGSYCDDSLVIPKYGPNKLSTIYKPQQGWDLVKTVYIITARFKAVCLRQLFGFVEVSLVAI